MRHRLATVLILAFYCIGTTIALAPLLSSYSIELTELPIKTLKKTLQAKNAKIRLLNTQLCFNWQGFTSNHRNRKLSYSIELYDCERILANYGYGHFALDMTKNETTNLYNTFIHSQQGQDQGCFGSSIQTSLKNSRILPEDIEEFIYMRYCPTPNYPDISTYWSLRPALYEERSSSFASDKDVEDSRGQVRTIRTKSRSKQLVAKSYVYRFENVITIGGEQANYCISKSKTGARTALRLSECGPMTPWIDQWFEIIEEPLNGGWKRKISEPVDDQKTTSDQKAEIPLFEVKRSDD